MRNVMTKWIFSFELFFWTMLTILFSILLWKWVSLREGLENNNTEPPAVPQFDLLPLDNPHFNANQNSKESNDNLAQNQSDARYDHLVTE